MKIIETRRICAKNSVFVPDSSCSQLVRFVQLLREWNARLNLISRKDVDNIWEAHILHSLSIALEHTFPEKSSVLDLGSGGGLPGIPLKIVRPDLALTMLDATRKKTDAVQAMVTDLGLKNVNVVWGRAEDREVETKLEKSFDVVVARAVAALQDLAKWSLHLVRATAHRQSPGPHLISLKGGNIDDELRRTKKLSFVKDVRAKDLTFNGAETIPGTEKKIVFVSFDI